MALVCKQLGEGKDSIKVPFGTKYVCMYYRNLEFKKPSFQFGILDPRDVVIVRLVR